MRQHPALSRPQPQEGAILLVVLVLLAVIGMSAASITLETSSQQQRANEEELLFVGEEYRQAIESYLRQPPNGVRAFPTKLEDLVADDRYPQPRRHLRKLYRDPVAPQQDWVLIKVGNALVGVRSSSKGVPFKTSGFTPKQVGFAEAETYAQWEFKVEALVPASQKPGAAPAPTTPAGPKPVPRKN